MDHRSTSPSTWGPQAQALTSDGPWWPPYGPRADPTLAAREQPVAPPPRSPHPDDEHYKRWRAEWARQCDEDYEAWRREHQRHDAEEGSTSGWPRSPSQITR